MRKLIFLFWSIFAAAHEPSLRIEEVGRINLADGYPSVYYRLHAEHFPSGEKFQLFSERVDGRKQLLETYTVNDAGDLVGTDGTDLRNNIQMAAYFCVAEPFRYVLEGKEYEITSHAVPHPVVAYAADGASLSVEMASLDGKIFLCLGEGFGPEEKVRLCSVSMGHAIDEVVTADAGGKIWTTLEPAVKKKKTGKCALELRRPTGTLAVKFDWGKDALKKPTARIADIPDQKSRDLALQNLLQPYQVKR